MSLQAKASTKHESQALYIYNFLKFIEWPDNNMDRIIVSVYGESAVYDELVKITKNKTIGEKYIYVIKSTNPQDMKLCNIVFVPEQSCCDINNIIDQIKNKTTVVVGAKEGANSRGSSIELIENGSKMGYRINKEVVQTQNLIYSQQLLKMSN
jgi:hypothetical protein